MRYRGHRPQQQQGLDFNATPMIDMVFLLTIFFMLVSRFASAENISLKVPAPHVSQAKDVKIPDRVVLNCRLVDENDPDRGVLYGVGPNPEEPLSDVARRLKSLKQQQPDLKVIVRADRRLRYEDVRSVLKVVAAQDIPILNVAAQVGPGSP